IGLHDGLLISARTLCWRGYTRSCPRSRQSDVLRRVYSTHRRVGVGTRAVRPRVGTSGSPGHRDRMEIARGNGRSGGRSLRPFKREKDFGLTATVPLPRETMLLTHNYLRTRVLSTP